MNGSGRHRLSGGPSYLPHRTSRSWHGRHRTSGTRSLASYTVNPSGAILLVIGLVDSIGTGLYLAGSAIYFTRVVGLTTTQVGIGLSLAGLLGFFAQAPLGWVADQIGPRRLLIIMNVVRAIGFTAYIFVGDFTSFLVVAALLGAPEQAVHPVYQALVERVVGAEHRLGFMARVRSTYNVGFTLGALLATVALNIGTRLAFDSIFVADAFSFLFAALLLPKVALLARPAETGPRSRRMKLSAIKDLRYLAVAGTNGVLTLHMAMLSVAMPLWVTLYTKAPRSLVGLLLVVNTVMAVVLQVRATRGTDTVPGAARVLRRAAVMLAVACLMFAAAAHLSRAWAIPVLVAALIGLTAGELLQSAGGWALSYQLAPERNRAEHLATFSLGTSAQFVAGPTIIAVGVLQQGVPGWFALAGVFLFTAVLIGPVVTAAQNRPALRPADPAPAGARHGVTSSTGGTVHA
jgi:MFS family permease